MDYKSIILESLEKLRKKETADKEIWKSRAYSTAIKQINLKEGPINSIDDIEGIKGIGIKIKGKITEIIDTGKLGQLQNYDKDYEAINILLQVHGLGPVKAKELVSKYNIKTIDDLRKNLNLLNNKQILALKYVDDFNLRIKFIEMKKHDEFIKAHIHNIDPLLIVEIVGSYRRKAKDSGDIDILITHPSDDKNTDQLLKMIVESLQKTKYIIDTFALGNKKFLGICKIKYGRHFRRLDLLVTKKNEFAFALMYFTGSKEFNVELRKVALNKGLSLSEYGFKYNNGSKKGKFVEQIFNSEEDIFNFLGLKYIKPEDRKANIIEKYLL